MTHRPLRIAHLADSHLGYRALGRSCPETGRNQRSVDIERSFMAAIDDILRRDVDLILHAGDLFHHTRPSWSTLRCFVRTMRRVEAAGIPTIIIGGNHDTPRLRSTGSVFGLLELALPSIRFEAGYDLIEVPFKEHTLTVHAVPHGSLTGPVPPSPLPDTRHRNVLVTHGLTPGAHVFGRMGNEPGETVLAADLLAHDLDYVALGHFHIAGDQGRNAWYAGSSERIGWGDESVKPGYLIVTLGDPGAVPEIEVIPIDSARPMKSLHPINGEDRTPEELADTILDRLRALGMPDAMTRIELRDTTRPVRREVESLVQRQVGDLVWSIRIYAASDVRALFNQPVGDQPIADLDTLFRDFVDQRERDLTYDPVFATAFRERGTAAIHEAQVQAEESAAASEPAA
ncbi:MAG: metallophosphoesterase [Chloroflexota bacterium]|nr:metallophosphoesterase [Chloroflexota bacterium]